MQAPGSFLRSSQRLGLRRATSLPTKSSLPIPAIRRQGYQYRTQHDKYGPHKEYFQIPGREPKPDLTPYVREPQRQSQSSRQMQPQPQAVFATHTPGQPGFVEDAMAGPQGWLRVPRSIRSAIWFFLFLQIGWAAGVALITWEYLSPPFEPGSPEEQELIEEILDALDTHPMVEDLRENEWVEVDAFTPDLKHGVKGRNMVYQVLGPNNTQGMFVRVFHHPSQEYTMLVFFFGFGIEGWPDIVHGGAITTILQEGLSKHVAYYYPGYLTTFDSSTTVDFKKYCKPGEIYGVLVAPSGRKSTRSGNVYVTELQMTGLLVQLAGAPVVKSEFDAASNTETHTVGIPASGGNNPTHAVCQGTVKILPKDFNQGQKPVEVGGKDDGSFGRALDFLKTLPEFKNTNGPPSSNEQKEQEETEKKDED